MSRGSLWHRSPMWKRSSTKDQLDDHDAIAKPMRTTVIDQQLTGYNGNITAVMSLRPKELGLVLLAGPQPSRAVEQSSNVRLVDDTIAIQRYTMLDVWFTKQTLESGVDLKRLELALPSPDLRQHVTPLVSTVSRPYEEGAFLPVYPQ